MEVVKRLMLKEMPLLPNVVLSGCHVTDVAEAHLAAMIKPEANDQRHIVVSTLESDSFKVRDRSNLFIMFGLPSILFSFDF